ncbi:DUF1573 domain-containing protein [Patescibacteria group bacterium]|nr:DUF1573 domain-containing protein [Patescibacteria group bacterium]
MNKKFLLGIGIFTVVIIGVAFLVVGNGSQKAVVQKNTAAKIQLDHSLKDLGNIPYEKGVTYHSFPIKNIGTANLEIVNIKTSCMCTNAFFRKGKSESPQFGMSTPPSDWKGVLKPGEEAEIVAAFDAKYHGPQGVGPIARSVSFETNDADSPYVEFNFNGTVVK